MRQGHIHKKRLERNVYPRKNREHVIFSFMFAKSIQQALQQIFESQKGQRDTESPYTLVSQIDRGYKEYNSVNIRLGFGKAHVYVQKTF